MHPSHRNSAASTKLPGASQFARDLYVVFQPSLPSSEILLMYQYACYAAVAGATLLGDGQVPGTPCSYGDPMMDGLLQRLLPQVEEISGIPLFPTYSYFRIYKTGDVLKRHVDRYSCEISVSLCLGYDASQPWPLWLDCPQGVRSVALEPGEALVYRGMQCPHWREEFHGKHWVQVFLHYVDRNGPNAQWKFDKRDSLSAPKVDPS